MLLLLYGLSFAVSFYDVFCQKLFAVVTYICYTWQIFIIIAKLGVNPEHCVSLFYAELTIQDKQVTVRLHFVLLYNVSEREKDCVDIA